MNARPNPTQHRKQDELVERRLQRGLLRPGVVLDAEDFALVMADPFGSYFTRTMLRAWLEELRPQLERRVLTEEQQAELARFVYEKGPRPAFVLAPVGASAYRTDDEETAHALALAERRDQGPKELPGEPGRYVQPSGRFARAGDPGFDPDRR